MKLINHTVNDHTMSVIETYIAEFESDMKNEYDDLKQKNSMNK